MASYCTRTHSDGPRVILPEELEEFLRNDHLCRECAYESDDEYAQRTATLPEVSA